MIPIINNRVPKRKKIVISHEKPVNIGKIWLIMYVIRYVQERKIDERMNIGRRNSIQEYLAVMKIGSHYIWIQ
jgi:hypothetical protein